VDEQVVDAGRVKAFKEVVGGDDPQIVLQPEERLVDFVDQVRFDGTGEDGVPIFGDTAKVVGPLGTRAGR
jgi:hypothetical protein